MTYLRQARCAACGLRLRYGTDYYVLKNRIWNKAMTGRATGRNGGCAGAPGHLHIVCAERRLGRELRQRDFEVMPVNYGAFGFEVWDFAP